jgi:hypothetical protein
MALSDYINPCTFSFESDKPIDILQQMRTEIIRKALIDKGYQELAELEDFFLIKSLKIIDSQLQDADAQIFIYNDSFIIEIMVKPEINDKYDKYGNFLEMSPVFKVRS